jgi:hypothetical protein
MERTLQQIVDDTLEPYMVGLTADEEQVFLKLLRQAHEAVVAAVTEGEEPPVRAPSRPRSMPTKVQALPARGASKASPRSRSTR